MKTKNKDAYKMALDLTIEVHKLIIEFELYDEGRVLRDVSIKIKTLVSQTLEIDSASPKYGLLLTSALSLTFDIKEEIEEFLEADFLSDLSILKGLSSQYNELGKLLFVLRDQGQTTMQGCS